MFLRDLDLEGRIIIIEVAKGKVWYCSRDLMVYPTKGMIIYELSPEVLTSSTEHLILN